ncbi:MAG: agmatinase family protein [Bacteroidales bacterium]|jgi:agmatinase|nr:agmatinase family protein [Bacteroidales bacterium]
MFNPNDIAITNGHYFGFPDSVEESEIVLIPVPWDVTTSYRAGTSNAPEAIKAASLQLDFFDFDVDHAWETRIGTEVLSQKIVDANKTYRKLSEQLIADLECGKPADEKVLESINKACEVVNNYVYALCKSHLDNGKKVGLIGGDHSSPLGYIQALSDVYDDFGILHFDAHADLRKAYEGFTYSHASIMYNALQLPSVKKLVQVGVRDLCQDEIDLVNGDERVVQFNDFALKEAAFSGYTWKEQCASIIQQLPQNVYVSFDIDALSPENCPNTGTPVPGGLSYNEAIFLIKLLHQSGRTIIGFDLCEVGIAADEWDANVGARVLYKLCLMARV